ncbi:MAG: acetyltransferase [Verrucomicrobiota bacterium]
MSEPLIIYGAGGHAKVAIDAARAAGLNVSLVLDDHSPHGELLGIPVRRGSEAENIPGAFQFFVAIGNNAVRAAILERLVSLSGTPFSIIHPSAVISPLAEIGSGTILAAGCIINPGARIGRNCVINTAASIDHDCALGDHVFIGPGARLAGTVQVDEGASVFTGAVVIPGIRIGKSAIVGAGAVVLKNVPQGVTVAGNPARPIPSRA